MTQYFKNTGNSLFCSNYLFEEALRKNSNKFLINLNEIIDFEKYSNEALKLYKAKATLGAPIYAPSIMLKILFLTYLFNVSEREIERLINDSISMKFFLNLGIEQPAPDHSSLTIFRNRILKQDFNILEQIFNEIIKTAQEKGVKFGKIQAIDSTHTLANVNLFKEKKRQKPKSSGGSGKKPRDPDAKTGVKGFKSVKTKEGEKVQIPKYIYGFKNHLSVNTKTNMVTSLEVTDASKYDGHYFKPLLEKDLQTGISKMKKTTYTADKGYEDGENNAWLNKYQLKDAIFYKGMGKIKEAKVKFFKYTSQKEFSEGATERYAVERVNGSLKKHGGLDRARYLGLKKMKIQTYLTTIVHNLKTLSRLLFGIYFRSPARI